MKLKTYSQARYAPAAIRRPVNPSTDPLSQVCPAVPVKDDGFGEGNAGMVMLVELVALVPFPFFGTVMFGHVFSLKPPWFSHSLVA